MVSRTPRVRRLLASLALAAPLALAGCSAEFGGRCAETAECGDERICIQGYCLPPDSPDRFNDGGADAGPGADGSTGTGCDAPGPTPAYDDALRPCADESTAALWRFDDSFEARVPAGSVVVSLAGTPNADWVKVDPEGGVFGGAAVFAGGGDPELVMTEPVRVTLPLTIELWARASGQDGDSRTLVGNLELDESPEIAGGFELTVDQTGRDPNLYQFGLAYAELRNRRQFEAAATFVVDTWVHLAAVIEADGTVKLYVDGVEQVFDPIPAAGAGRDLVFGRRAEDTGQARPYPGALDEVRLSTIARSADALRRAAEGVTRPQ